MLLYTFSGTAVLLGLAGLCLAVGGSILLLRGVLRHRPLDSSGKRLKNAAFSFTGPVHRLSLCVAIAASFIAINWTQFEPEQMVYGDVEVIEDLIDIDIPPTGTPPPPPPPPPPPVIESVPDDVEVEPEPFIDQSIDDSEAVLPPAPPAIVAPAAAPPPPPPPPPPPADEYTEFVTFAEQMPLFGEDCFDLPSADRKSCSDRQLLGFVQSRVQYPSMARENGVEGTVVIQFTVEKDGTISDVVPARKVGAGCTEAALKAVNAITKEGRLFQPGMQAGRKVRVRFNLPVKFQLQK
ncbi:energy transducer TonB [Neolewinella agarilytica]|uniref:Protein TonB n=1 Tax=Neolewinella agarilytica TaxID=478744 RepID=A0A1H9C7R0_9BACT|nr:energy transducer TonB [Neolewinella agarilytica]SEP97179.1 protein TonB [Neolewinella agarilytica]